MVIFKPLFISVWQRFSWQETITQTCLSNYLIKAKESKKWELKEVSFFAAVIMQPSWGAEASVLSKSIRALDSNLPRMAANVPKVSVLFSLSLIAICGLGSVPERSGVNGRLTADCYWNHHRDKVKTDPILWAPHASSHQSACQRDDCCYIWKTLRGEFRFCFCYYSRRRRFWHKCFQLQFTIYLH